MIKQLIEYLLNIASKHIAVNYTAFKQYQDINNQHNHDYYQFIIEDEGLLENQIIEGVLTLKLDIDILGFLTKDKTNIDVQDEALHILLDWIEYIKNDNNQLEVKDYSAISFSKFTDDNTSGIRATVQFIVPSIINLCTFEDNFIEKPKPIIPDLDIKDKDECTNEQYVPDNDNQIDLNPIKIF